MTNFEQKNPRKVTSGSKAYLMGIHIQNNPYKTKPQRERWEKGYRAAKRFTEGVRFTPTNEPEQTKRFERSQHDRKPQSSPAFVQRVGRITRRPEPRTERPVMTAKRVDQFNNKFRTAV